ncbi:hypothetical protein BYT27DRAFT_7145861 [Phlegmacium glaucopus]|nr:hypothetical protein BYT27DRAFT_7145861 [Phlegmacium glaucopus]
MLSSRPVQLTTDAPYFPTKTPGRALGNRAENAHLGTLTMNPKGKMPRTPFQPASTQRKVVKDHKLGLTSTTTTTRRPIADKTPLPNRIGAILFQTPLPQKQNIKPSKLAFVVDTHPDAINQTKSMLKNGCGKTPDSVQRPSSMRKHVKHPRSAAAAAAVTQNFETPMNRGNHWDVSDGDIVLLADMQAAAALQDTITENGDDLDEIEFMAPNTLNLPYDPPLDFELPDYKVLGKNLRRLAHSCPYDDLPSPPELDFVVSDLPSSTWDMFTFPPLSLEDDPFHQARAELAQASGKTSLLPTSRARMITKTGLQPTNHTTNPVLLSKATRQPQRTLPIPNTKSSRPETATSVGTATTSGTTAKGKSTASKLAPAAPSMNPKGIATATGTTTTRSTLSGPVKSTYHKSAVSLGSRPTGVVIRATTTTVRRPHTVLDINKKRDKPVGVHGALMLVKDLHIEGDVIGEDFLFEV